MAITNGLCNSFKVDLLCARHNFLLSGGHTFKMALYLTTASVGPTTTAYTATGEVANGGGYATGGKDLTRIDPLLDGTTGITDFADLLWPASTITAGGALIYNDSATLPVADASVCALSFGGDKISSAGDFTVAFPAAVAATAIIRIV